jgi:hypothetical protein
MTTTMTTTMIILIMFTTGVNKTNAYTPPAAPSSWKQKQPLWVKHTSTGQNPLPPSSSLQVNKK